MSYRRRCGFAAVYEAQPGVMPCRLNPPSIARRMVRGNRDDLDDLGMLVSAWNATFRAAAR
jgi:hypothetical protein